MQNLKKIATDNLIPRLRTETAFRVVRFNMPSTAEAMYQALTGGITEGLDTVYVSGGALTFDPLDTMSTLYNATVNLDLFLASNNIREAQLEDVDRRTDEMFALIAGALKDYFITINGAEFPFTLGSLNPLFYDDGIDAQQLQLKIIGLEYDL